MSSSAEPPLPQKRRRGCFGKGCLAIIAVVLVLLLSLTVGAYFFLRHSILASKPISLPIEELSSQQLTETKQRIRTFKSNGVKPPEHDLETPAAAGNTQLELSSDEINGLIAANRRARGHAFVTLSGNAATVQLSISASKLTGAEGRYLNSSFVIETAGPTAPSLITVKKTEANGWPVPSAILQWHYRGRSILSYALDAIIPYRIATIEIRNGKLITTQSSAQ
ncbi:MAG TPA: hypothetical protein VGQ82_03880 [Chthoniobacterales bacterium]|nr:hypothetical protein [Chthoniobacterales bacterium]